MDYEGVEVKYLAGQPYVGAIVRMFPGPGGNRGRFIAWDPTVGKVKFDLKENLAAYGGVLTTAGGVRSEEHTSELQSRLHLVCRLLLEKKKKNKIDELNSKEQQMPIISSGSL